MSLDFAIKDFFRKKDQTFPYMFTIVLAISFSVFFVYLTSSLGLSFIVEEGNEYFFSGGINIIYTNFNRLILIFAFVLSFIIVVVITTTLTINKKRDIAIMKSLGTLPRKLYGFYLLEVYILFFTGFLFGLVLGLAFFGIFALIMNFFIERNN